jgi:hypothetical protein
MLEPEDSPDTPTTPASSSDHPLIHLLPQLKEFLTIKDPQRVDRAMELLANASSEEELFADLQAEYGDVEVAEEDQPAVTKKQKTKDKFIESDSDSDESEDSPTLPICKYGKSCYRKNPVHFQEFSHPWKNTQ